MFVSTSAVQELATLLSIPPLLSERFKWLRAPANVMADASTEKAALMASLDLFVGAGSWVASGKWLTTESQR